MMKVADTFLKNEEKVKRATESAVSQAIDKNEIVIIVKLILEKYFKRCGKRHFFRRNRKNNF